jgi:hypothetical protein
LERERQDNKKNKGVQQPRAGDCGLLEFFAEYWNAEIFFRLGEFMKKEEKKKKKKERGGS